MSREIKFRAWNTKEKTFTTQQSDQRLDLALRHYELNPHVEYPQQFTGLKDKSGVEIYEGDIIQFPTLYETPENTSTEYSTEQVVFQLGAFYLKTKDGQYNGEPTLAYEMYCYDGDFEVIGNIYQTPELL